MAKNTSDVEDSLMRSLYVYDLSPEILTSLTVRTNGHPTQPETTGTPKSDISEPGEKRTQIAISKSCTLCHLFVETVEEHREHVRSDHHRYNVKAQVRGNVPLTEVEFNRAIEELDESISGSEMSESDEDDEGLRTSDSTLAALLKKQAMISQGNQETESSAKIMGGGKQPIFWFKSSLLPKSTFLGVYRALFTDVEQNDPDQLVESLRQKQLSPLRQRLSPAATREGLGSVSARSPHVFLCMVGGGHFAAMVVALAAEVQRRPGGVEERQARVLAHKTFHRYTTRRKQGGAQSTSDAARGAAHSAGSSLRRHNEAALEKEIRGLLLEWRGMIDEAELLFVRATGSTNRRTLFGPYDSQILRKNDSRLRGFPFSTRRATQAELMRCFKELTRVKTSRVEEAPLAVPDTGQPERIVRSPKPSSQQQKPQISEEDEAALLHTSQIQALIRRSKAPALLSYISNNNISPSFTFYPSDSPQNHHSPTPLHLASSSNSTAIVLALLTKAKFDPTVVSREGKSPFDLARDRATRDSFRIARHELGESVWNWDAAHVPSPLSKAEVDSREERERRAAEEAEADRRKIEMEQLKIEDATNTDSARNRRNLGGRTLGAIEKTFTEKTEEEMRGMTPEMRQKLERERRARAAEERIRRMQGK
ncbi:hypothetical protein Egran_00083 [Elaphomyces granulatus]|uniref:VLRF1 domain-containing protein n=1 Tax=Elaphomyces granulatus TaxID=519963 RepID=A0A232M6W7_9EURO|nr:hypothetical protein Egran_00083 [Elaphomyces granulatus]